MSQRSLILTLAWPMATGIFVLGLVSCGDRQKEAKSELTAKSFTFTVDEYMRAAREGNVTALKHFMEAGMEVDVTDAEGTTAMFRAAQAGQAEAVKYLTSKGASLQVTGTGFDTPLVAAARTGTVEAVKVLLEAKADPGVRTTRNWTALTAAAYRGDVDMVNVLAPLSSGSIDEALQIASLQGKPSVVDALLRHGADVFSRSKDNKTPLMYAAANGHGDVVRLLMLSGANKLLIDNDKQTAADLALAAGHPEIVAVLDDPKLVQAAVPAPEVAATDAPGATVEASASREAAAVGAEETPAVPSEISTDPDAAVASATVPPTDAPLTADPELTTTVASTAPFESPTGDETPGGPVAAEQAPPSHPRLQGARLAGLADGSTEALKQSVRVRDFREAQLPIVLEDVPAVGESARIRVLGHAGTAPEIVPAGGAIGDTGLELVRVERKFMNSKMGEGHLLDVSHAVVRNRATGQRHIVRKDQTAASTQATALISAGNGGEVYEVQEGDEFTAGENQPSRYKVLDVRPTQVVIENLDTRETATLARSYAR